MKALHLIARLFFEMAGGTNVSSSSAFLKQTSACLILRSAFFVRQYSVPLELSIRLCNFWMYFSLRVNLYSILTVGGVNFRVAVSLCRWVFALEIFPFGLF